MSPMEPSGLQDPGPQGALMACCKCAWSYALTTLLRGRAARRRRSSASRPRSALARRALVVQPQARKARGPRPRGEPRPQPHGGQRGGSGIGAVLVSPPALSRSGSAQGDATRWRLTEGLFVTSAPENNFPRAETGSQPELLLSRNGVVLSRWFSADPS